MLMNHDIYELIFVPIETHAW